MTLKFNSAKCHWMSRIPLELVCWTVALIGFALAEPIYPQQENHFSFCPLAAAGIDWCPGCGLGRSMTLFLHGKWAYGYQQHWLGGPAVLLITGRIYVLAKAACKKLIVKRRR